MAKLTIKAGTTSKSVGLFFQDSTSTNGAGLSGLASNTANFVCYWYQPGVTGTNAVTIAALASAAAAWASGGFFEIDATRAKGHYRFDPPNAALTGASSSIFVFSGAANQAQLQLEFELTAVDNQSATAFVTSVPSVAGTVGAAASVSGTVGAIAGFQENLSGGTNLMSVLIGATNQLNQSTVGGKRFIDVNISAIAGNSNAATLSGGFLKVDLESVAGDTAAASVDANHLLNVNTKDYGGTAVTALPNSGTVTLGAFAVLAGGSNLLTALTAQTNRIGTLTGGGNTMLMSDMEAIAGNTNAVGLTGNLLNVSPVAGSGANIVTQNQGGANNLQPSIADIPQPNVEIRAYLQSDYNLGRLAQAYVKDQTYTDSNGNWVSTMRLASGVYAFTYNDNRDIFPATLNVTVP